MEPVPLAAYTTDELLAELARREVAEADRWAARSPDGLEYFDTRPEAEAFLLDWFTTQLADTGEGQEENGLIMAVVAHTREVVGATSEDPGERGEWCRERGHDYEITGYELASGSGVVRR